MRDYRLISADGHVNEPPDIWKARLPAKYQERAPHMERFEKGDAWVMEGWQGPINFGFNFSAGIPPEKRSPWKFWEEIPAAGYEPAARLRAQDEDGVDAEVLYPTPRPAAALFSNNGDPQFHVACIRAYNDWLSELCAHDPDRFVGMAMIPTIGVGAAVEELERVMKLPGIGSPYLGMWPNAGPEPTLDDDRFWAAVEEMGVPVSIHISVSAGGSRGDGDTNRTRPGARGELHHIATPGNCLELINTGVFDRFPDLRVVFAECDSGWVPYVKEQFDDRFRRHGPATRPDIKHIPSYYFDHNIFTTFVVDRYAIINRQYVGVSQFMWSGDFAHVVTDWPHSWDTINDHFAGVPDEEKHAILAGNAARVYKMANGT